MEFFKNIKKNIDLITNKINEIKQKIDDFKQVAKDSIFTKIVYWFFMITIWWPMMYSFLFLYYLGIWPFLKILGGLTEAGSDLSFDSSSPDSSSSDSSSSDSSNSRKRNKWTPPVRRPWKIQVYNSNYWSDVLNGDTPDHNYISQELQIKKMQNEGKKVRAIYRDTGEVIDIL